MLTLLKNFPDFSASSLSDPSECFLALPSERLGTTPIYDSREQLRT